MSNTPSDAVGPTNSDDFDVENPIRKSTRKGKMVKQTSAASELLGSELDLRWWTDLGKCTARPVARSRSFRGVVVVYVV